MTHLSIHFTLSPCVYPQVFPVPGSWLGPRSDGNCGSDTFSVLKELRTRGGDIMGSTAAFSMTQADDCIHSMRASSSLVIPPLLDPEASVRQVRGIEKSAHRGSTSHEAMHSVELVTAAKGRVQGLRYIQWAQGHGAVGSMGALPLRCLGTGYNGALRD